MDRIETRRWWRAAWDIHQRLAEIHVAPAVALPGKEWGECRGGVERLSWLKATQQLLSYRWLEPEVSQQLRGLKHRIDVLLTDISRFAAPERIASTADIYRDLEALEEEFEEVELDLHKKLISVTTEAIYLADQDLGPFRIELHLKPFNGSGLRYEVHALDSDEQYPHPHIAGSSLCEGEATELIATALTQGRVFDFFVTVRQVLRNYDPNGAFDGFRDGDTVTCTDCGYSGSRDEFYSCNLCEYSVCDECNRMCESCGHICCHGCLVTCPTCRNYTCHACKKKCPSCDEFYCKGCLSDGDCESCREESEESPETPTEAELLSPS